MNRIETAEAWRVWRLLDRLKRVGTLALLAACGYTMAGASHLAEKVRPQAGDPCVCIACAELVVFSDLLGVVKPTPAELMDLQANPVWRQIEHTRQAVLAMHGEIAAGRLPLKRKP